MCFGPSSAQQGLEAQQQSLSYQMAQDYAQRFAGQDQTLDKLNNILFNVQNGKLLPGLSTATKTAMSSENINDATANAKNVLQAVGNANAAHGGSSSGLESGIEGAERANVLTGVANQKARGDQNIQLADQQAQEQNTAMALGGYDTLAGIQNPLGFGSEASGAGQSAYNMATENATIGAQEFGDIAGGVAALGGTALKAFGVGGFGNPKPQSA
jgi:hypothetical protein